VVIRRSWEISSIRIKYDGLTTNLTFANGTSISFDSTAETYYDLNGVHDDKSFFDAFCTGVIFGISSDEDMKSRLQRMGSKGRLGQHPSVPVDDYHYGCSDKRQIRSTQYQTAMVKAESAAAAGYFLNGDGNDDIDVRKIITFDPTNDASGAEFQSTIKQFLARSQTR
jgi:hypothetical protein